MKLRDWPEFDLIRPAGANRLIVGFKTVRTIAIEQWDEVLRVMLQTESEFPWSVYSGKPTVGVGT